ncbi:MAG: ABC transporter ATP-binding protein [Deltaproteobacteria bacterium]|nr:ABC transporter ATP-binding protein [Deltaproteobacteria bacterium]
MMPFLEMKNISKRFVDVVANDRVCFDVERGEVHTLLGENGAGKSTLMNILYGLYSPDEGEIYMEGNLVKISSPYDAIELHIGMIHQHFTLIPNLSVTENIILGLPSSSGFLLELKKAEENIDNISRKYELRVDPKSLVRQLPVGLQQRVEILKALYRKTDILILDEPTSVLTPLEVETFFKIIRRFTEDGLAVIFISHKLNEVMSISDRITVLRGGNVVGTLKKLDTDANKLAGMMVGKEITLSLDKPSVKKGKRLLEVRGLSVNSEKGGKPLVNNVSFDIHEGEILGVAGVDGNGQGELADAIAGLQPVSKGQILINGMDVAHLSPRKRIERKLGYIPSDRQRVGLIVDFSVAQNLVLKNFCDPPFSTRRLFLSHKNITSNADQMIKEFDIKVSHGNEKVAFLSGGNQQKVILAREISGKPDVLIAMQPTRGLDVGSTRYVHQCILQHREQGGATLFISTELDEVIAISDRIGVMFEGEIMGIIPGGDRADLEQISLMMAGVREQKTKKSVS